MCELRRSSAGMEWARVCKWWWGSGVETVGQKIRNILSIFSVRRTAARLDDLKLNIVPLESRLNPVTRHWRLQVIVFSKWSMISSYNTGPYFGCYMSTGLNVSRAVRDWGLTIRQRFGVSSWYSSFDYCHKHGAPKRHYNRSTASPKFITPRIPNWKHKSKVNESRIADTCTADSQRNHL
jgi:hypothetical protein